MDEERRTNSHLRIIFEEAVELTAPFFDSAQSWGDTPLIGFAQVTIRETYPNLTPQDVDILLSALQRVYTERRNK